MRIPSWVWKSGTTGKIAIVNMACAGLCAWVHLSLFPDHVVYLNLEPAWKLVLGDVSLYGLLLLSFPVGSVSLLPGSTGPPWLTLVFVPLNGYFWGAVGWATWRRELENKKSRASLISETMHACANQNCSVKFTVSLGQCPACGTLAPEFVSISRPVREQPPAWFIALVGFVAPSILGGLMFSFFHWILWALLALLAGAGSIFGIVRWLNRRDDPGRAPLPPIPQ